MKMKKNLVALLLVLVVVSFGLFADATPASAPGNAEFTVTTTVNGVAYMGVTTAAYSTPSASAYTLFENLDVTEAGVQTFTAFITSFSNSPAGYKIAMSATAMANTSETGKDPIHYTIGVTKSGETPESVAYATKTGGDAVEVYNSGALAAMSGKSYPLTLSVDSDSFAAATTGSYLGTVTFAYTAL